MSNEAFNSAMNLLMIGFMGGCIILLIGLIIAILVFFFKEI